MGYEKRLRMRSIKLGDVPISGKSFAISVEPEELSLIAERLLVLGVKGLRAEGIIKPIRDTLVYRIEGMVYADIVLNCSVTLDDFTQHFAESIGWSVSSDIQYKPDLHVTQSPDHPEYIDDSHCDPIEFAVQSLGLALPLSPRSADADLSDWRDSEYLSGLVERGLLTFNAAAEADDCGDVVGENPFAALARLKSGGRG